MKFFHLPLITVILLSAVAGKSFAVTPDAPKPLMPRVNTTGQVEYPVPLPDIQPQKAPVKVKAENQQKPAVTYGDLDTKKISEEIQTELQEEQNDLLYDLRILWQAAVERSETIRFAILKLSNPDGEIEKKSTVKKILEPLANVAPLIGAGSGSAVTGASTMLGGGLLSSLLSDNSAINNHLSRVTDTDLVILAQETDNLQQQLVTLYLDYMGSVQRLKYIDKIVQNRYKYYEATQNSAPEYLAVADVFYREALDMQYKERQEVLKSRAALEQFVGNEAISAVDKNIKERLEKASS